MIENETKTEGAPEARQAAPTREPFAAELEALCAVCNPAMFAAVQQAVDEAQHAAATETMEVQAELEGMRPRIAQRAYEMLEDAALGAADEDTTRAQDEALTTLAEAIADEEITNAGLLID